MDSIPENVPTETDLEMDSISQTQHSSCAVPEGDSSKSIAETAASKGCHVRRNSTGNISIPYKNVKILSRYLATTTASCHDHCKYGVTQDLDANMVGSHTLKTIAEKHTKGYYYMGKKSGPSFPPCSPRSPKPDSPVSTKGNLFRQFSVPLKGLVPRSKPTLSKLSVLSTEDHLGSKQMGNGKEEKTSKSNWKVLSSQANAPLSNLHSFKKDLTRNIVSLSPKQLGKKSDKMKGPKAVDKASKNDISIDLLSTNAQESNMEKRSTNAESEKSKHKRDRIMNEKDQESTARKLNFRRGKVTDNQSVTGPTRKLKFKQRSLSDTLVIDVEKIEHNLKSREICTNDAETNVESEKVVLKRQDGDQDKKEAQNLLNDMIEETANKLAETKKSKVKVLVGAFETVISLQDTKQTASMVDDAC